MSEPEKVRNIPPALNGAELQDLSIEDTELGISEDVLTRAKIIISAMVDAVGVDSEDIQIVKEVQEDGTNLLVAIDASPNGQHVGNYKAIQEKREEDPAWYQVQVGEERIDLLKGCTEGAYRAMIADARRRGVKLLPDSLALSQQNGELWTATMLTGEPLTEEGEVQLLSSSGGEKVNKVSFPLSRGGRSIRVRPAAVIAEV